MEELKMQTCPFCGITTGPLGMREFQQELARDEHRNLLLRWKQRNDPNELALGLPLTNEDSVHHALVLLNQKNPHKEPSIPDIVWAAKEAGVDYNDVVSALAYRQATGFYRKI